MQFFVILTLQAPTGAGYALYTVAKPVSVRPGTTRAELHEWARTLMPAHMQGGDVVFFSAEPNVLGEA